MLWTLFYPDFDHCFWKLCVEYFIENGINSRFCSKISPQRDVRYLLTPFQNDDLDLPRKKLKFLYA